MSDPEWEDDAASDIDEWMSEESPKVGGEGENEILVDIEEDLDDEDEEEENEFSEFKIEDLERVSIQKIVPTEMRKTSDIMTSYEKAHLIGRRAQQLEDGDKPLIENVLGKNSIEIAQEELMSGNFPLCVLRPAGGGHFEVWRVSEMIIM